MSVFSTTCLCHAMPCLPVADGKAPATTATVLVLVVALLLLRLLLLTYGAAPCSHATLTGFNLAAVMDGSCRRPAVRLLAVAAARVVGTPLLCMSRPTLRL